MSLKAVSFIASGAFGMEIVRAVSDWRDGALIYSLYVILLIAAFEQGKKIGREES